MSVVHNDDTGDIEWVRPIRLHTEHGLPKIDEECTDWDWGDITFPRAYYEFSEKATPARYEIGDQDRVLSVRQEHDWRKTDPQLRRRSVEYKQWLEIMSNWKRTIEKILLPRFEVWRKYQPTKFHTWFNRTYVFEQLKVAFEMFDSVELDQILKEGVYDDDDAWMELETCLIDREKMHRDTTDKAMMSLYRKCGLLQFPQSHYECSLSELEREYLIESAASLVFQLRHEANRNFYLALEYRKKFNDACEELRARQNETECQGRKRRRGEHTSFEFMFMETTPSVSRVSTHLLESWKEQASRRHDEELRQWCYLCKKQRNTLGRVYGPVKEFYELKPRWLTGTVDLTKEYEDHYPTSRLICCRLRTSGHNDDKEEITMGAQIMDSGQWRSILEGYHSEDSDDCGVIWSGFGGYNGTECSDRKDEGSEIEDESREQSEVKTLSPSWSSGCS